MRKELPSVQFVAINTIGAVAITSQPDLVARTEYPLFQDTDMVNAWDAHGGAKDDIFVYGSDGKLAHYLKYGGAIPTDLSVTDNYAAIKNLIADTK